jgi:hypothetical protein
LDLLLKSKIYDLIQGAVLSLMEAGKQITPHCKKPRTLKNATHSLRVTDCMQWKGSCENSTEPSSSTRDREFLNQLSNY